MKLLKWTIGKKVFLMGCWGIMLALDAQVIQQNASVSEELATTQAEQLQSSINFFKTEMIAILNF